MGAWLKSGTNNNMKVLHLVFLCSVTSGICDDFTNDQLKQCENFTIALKKAFPELVDADGRVDFRKKMDYSRFKSKADAVAQFQKLDGFDVALPILVHTNYKTRLLRGKKYNKLSSRFPVAASGGKLGALYNKNRLLFPDCMVNTNDLKSTTIKNLREPLTDVVKRVGPPDYVGQKFKLVERSNGSILQIKLQTDGTNLKEADWASIKSCVVVWVFTAKGKQDAVKARRDMADPRWIGYKFVDSIAPFAGALGAYRLMIVDGKGSVVSEQTIRTGTITFMRKLE